VVDHDPVHDHAQTPSESDYLFTARRHWPNIAE